MIACRPDALRPSLRFVGGQPFGEILDIMRQRSGTLGQLIGRLTRRALLRRGLLRVRLRRLLALLLRLLRLLRGLRLLRSRLARLLARLCARLLARLLGLGLRGLLRPLLSCRLL
jgi:hypothetical protein